MVDKPPKNRETSDIRDFEDFVGAPGEAHAPTPLFLNLMYVIVIVIGILMFVFFWNGSDGLDEAFDRGAWAQLQRAARTTYPWHDNVVTHPVEHNSK